jgi:hypothetical protein
MAMPTAKLAPSSATPKALLVQKPGEQQAVYGRGIDSNQNKQQKRGRYRESQN